MLCNRSTIVKVPSLTLETERKKLKKDNAFSTQDVLYKAWYKYSCLYGRELSVRPGSRGLDPIITTCRPDIGSKDYKN
jgi:hypothetical protein